MTTTMLRDHYQREVNPIKGEKGRELERRALAADLRVGGIGDRQPKLRQAVRERR